MANIENLKITSIERVSRRWEVRITATVAGVAHEGLYEVSDEDIHERWFEPTGPNGSITDEDDDDYTVITDGTTTARIYCDDYAATWKAAREFASDAIFDLERQIDVATADLIAKKVA